MFFSFVSSAHAQKNIEKICYNPAQNNTLHDRKADCYLDNNGKTYEYTIGYEYGHELVEATGNNVESRNTSRIVCYWNKDTHYLYDNPSGKTYFIEQESQCNDIQKSIRAHPNSSFTFTVNSVLNTILEVKRAEKPCVPKKELNNAIRLVL